MNLVLFGYHGSGKTVVGRTLSQQLWRDFLDVDARILEALAGKGLQGDALLQDAARHQAQILAGLSSDGELVVAASGVVMPDEETARVLKSVAKTIYLQTTPEVLAQRIAAGGPRRPAEYPFAVPGEPAEIAALLGKRDAEYAAMADLTLDTSPLDVATVSRLIVRMAM